MVGWCFDRNVIYWFTTIWIVLSPFEWLAFVLHLPLHTLFTPYSALYSMYTITVIPISYQISKENLLNSNEENKKKRVLLLLHVFHFRTIQARSVRFPYAQTFLKMYELNGVHSVEMHFCAVASFLSFEECVTEM